VVLEIELKARVGDPEERRGIISRFAGPAGEFLKEDTYWYPPSPPEGPSPRQENPGTGALPSGVRVRREEHRNPPGGGADRITRVCFKTKEKREGIEVNDEREFEVSRGEVFEELLIRLGLSPGVRKRKQGWVWEYGDALIELCEVSGSLSPGKAGDRVCLGWFVELEILAPGDRRETVAAARKRLFEVLEKTGIGKDRIEERYYTEMLREGSGPEGAASSPRMTKFR
jgi:adenylate cyclase class 2